MQLDLLGEVPPDPAVREAVQRRQLLLEALPGCAGGDGAGQLPLAAERHDRRADAASTTTRRRRRRRSSACGGEAGVRALVDRFYDLMDLEPAYAGIRALHPGTLDGSRDKLFWFLCGWLGGPDHYIERFGHPRLRARHLPYRHRHRRARPVDGLHGAGDARAGGRRRRWPQRLAESFFGTADWMRNR